MDSYIGVIYFRNGTKQEVHPRNGTRAEQECEMATAREFEVLKRRAISPNFEPTRYEVKKR